MRQDVCVCFDCVCFVFVFPMCFVCVFPILYSSACVIVNIKDRQIVKRSEVCVLELCA